MTDVHGNPAALQAAFDAARPGETIRIVSDYRQPEPHQSPVLARSGTCGKPITITAADGVRLRGLESFEPRCADVDFGPWTPKQGEPFFRLEGVEHVHVRDLRIDQAWLEPIRARNSRFLKFVGIHATGGRHVIRIKDEKEQLYRSHDIAVERCTWTQHPALWKTLSWMSVHHQQQHYNFMNGAFLRTDDIAGNVSFVNNTITDAFNGIKLQANRPEDVTELTHAYLYEPARANRNIRIAENRFERIRDNPIEPEGHAFNLHVDANTFLDCYAWLSFDGVAGGWWYVFANTGWFRSRPGPPADDVHRRGTVFKLDARSKESTPALPAYVFNNSFHLRMPLLGNANDAPPFAYAFDHWHIVDNAFEWRDGVEWIEAGGKDELAPNIQAVDPGIAFAERPRLTLLRNVTNAIGWTAIAHQAQGIVDEDPAGPFNRWLVQARVFAAGEAGDFALSAKVPRSCVCEKITIVLPYVPTGSAGPCWDLPAARRPGADQPGLPHGWKPPYGLS